LRDDQLRPQGNVVQVAGAITIEYERCERFSVRPRRPLQAAGEAVNPTAENAYWEQNSQNESYVNMDYDYNEYAPAYRTGYEYRAK
jgi:hypothetical protein